MTSIRFSRKEFESQIKITPEIKDKITMFGTSLESITNEELEVEILPNRPDLVPLPGFIRSFRKFLGKDPGLKKYKINKPEKDYKVTIEKAVREVRPYTVCAIVKKLKFTDEKIKDIINVQEKLALTLGRNRKKMGIGLYPLDKIKLPLVYTAKDPKEIKYQPLGSQTVLTGSEILVAHPTGRRYAHLLEGQKKYPVFIDSNKQILSMPPIVNSEQTGRIDLNTKEIFIECTGTDKNTLEKTLIIITSALADIGGEVYEMEIHDSEKFNSPNFNSQKLRISLDNTNKLLGLSLSENQISQMLQMMGHNYNKGIVEIAPWRTDIIHEVDLIEDVAIAYGYDNFIPEIPNISTSGEESKESIVKRKISEILTGLGMLEISTYHLIKQEEVDQHNLKDLLEIQDSKTEYKYLRPNLLIPLVRILGENKDAEYPQRVFEIGAVFSKNSHRETGIEEKSHLSIGITPGNSTDCKQLLDYIFKMLNLEYKISESTSLNLIEGRTATITLNEKNIGYFGEVHPITLKKAGIKMPVSVIELSLEEIYKAFN